MKDKAERIGGRFTFDRLREREGLGGRDKQGKEILNKSGLNVIAANDLADGADKIVKAVRGAA